MCDLSILLNCMYIYVPMCESPTNFNIIYSTKKSAIVYGVCLNILLAKFYCAGTI